MTLPQALALMAAGLHIPVALMVWGMLHRRWHALPLRLWVAGTLALGIGGALFATHGLVPAWASDELVHLLVPTAFALRIAALRLDLGWALRARTLALIVLADVALYFLLRDRIDAATLLPLGLAGTAAWTLAFAWHAAAAGRRLPSRSGWVLAAVEGVFAAALLLRMAMMASGQTEVGHVTARWDSALLVGAGSLAALYGSLGYLGVALDGIAAAARRAREAQQAEQRGREAAEGTSASLRALLAERDQLMRMLAHQIRQPLHNAGGALQSAALALDEAVPEPTDLAAAGQALAALKAKAGARLQRAQAVLSGVQSVLDNTLAPATLLARETPLVRVDTDVDFLVQLTLGDLPAAQRQRVQVHWRTDLPSAPMEPGLVRLALRNLLMNAFAHGGPDVQVALDVAAQAAPPALLLTVSDDGPGLPAAAAGAPAGASAPSEPATGRQRLGLVIVQRVMALHGGEFRQAAGVPRGHVASLVFPRQG